MPVTTRHLVPADYRVMPWKNGQGTTTEIAAYPPGAGLETFVWRISMADIGASGPFSVFPGVERILLQTEGEPMVLEHEGRGRRRLGLLEPVRFAGEWVTRGEVPAPPVRDFNVMARRGRVQASVAVWELSAGSRARTLEAAGGEGAAQVVYVFRGGLSARGAGGEVASLAAGDTWIVRGDEGESGFEVVSGETGAVAFVVAFR